MSDQCLVDYMTRTFAKGDLKCLPTFIHHTHRILTDENFDPNMSTTSSDAGMDLAPTNANPAVVKRNIRACQTHINIQSATFLEKTREAHATQQDWIKFS